MIFHTVCDRVYFDLFYKNFYQSLIEHYNDAKFSLNYVDAPNQEIKEFCNLNKIYWQNEILKLDDLREKFQGIDDGNLLGYYPLARWSSIPLELDHVCVCDVDILAIEKIDHELIEGLLQINDVVNITRRKPDGANGGMMLLCLSKRILPDVQQFSRTLVNNLNGISIAEDTKVRRFIYENFKIFELHNKMLDLTKPKYESNRQWFAYSKGGQGLSSIKKLEKLERNLKILRG